MWFLKRTIVLFLVGVIILIGDEFIEAYENGDLTEEDYNLVLEVKNKLLNEIKCKTNEYMNRDYSEYLFD